MAGILAGALIFVGGLAAGAFIFGGGTAIALSMALAEPSFARLYVDGALVDAEAYVIEDSNYFKLRDIAKAVDFGLWYDEALNKVYIETDIGYDPKYDGHRQAPSAKYVPLQRPETLEVDNKRLFDAGKSNTEKFTAAFTFVEVVRGEIAAEQVKQASVQNPGAGADKEYVLVWVRAKITDSKDKKTVTFADIKDNLNCYSSGGAKYPRANPANLNAAGSQPAAVGDTLEGWVAFAVERGDPGPRVAVGAVKQEESENVWFQLYN